MSWPSTETSSQNVFSTDSSILQRRTDEVSTYKNMHRRNFALDERKENFSQNMWNYMEYNKCETNWRFRLFSDLHVFCHLNFRDN